MASSRIGALIGLLLSSLSTAFAQQSASEDDWSLPAWVTRTANSGYYGGYGGGAEFPDVDQVNVGTGVQLVLLCKDDVPGDLAASHELGVRRRLSHCSGNHGLRGEDHGQARLRLWRCK